jgi:tetratricopeptide (TPR) repeat protein
MVSVLAEKARIEAFLNHSETAESVCLEALRLVEPLGLDDLHANVLNTYAVIKMMNGDLRVARPQMERALQLATSSAERVRTTQNLGVLWFLDGYYLEAERYGRMAGELARRMGEQSWAWWVHAAEIQQEPFGEGRWDEALALSAALLAETEAVGGHYMDPATQMMRAFIFAARGEDDAARFELERGLGSINPSGGMQAVAPTLNVAAQVNLLLGERDRAVDLIGTLVRTIREKGVRAPGPESGSAATIWRTGFADEWAVNARGFAETGRVWAANLVISGRGADAVPLYEQIGNEQELAAARWVAAEQLAREGRVAEAQPFLEGALAFYRKAGATRVIAHAEALFAAAS